jgi:hypothetical protein
MEKQVSEGKCNLCGGIFSKVEMTKHLQGCKETKISTTEKAQRAKTLHLLVEGRYQPEYWLHLEVPANAAFSHLDHFLRNIWLECCGHLSAFRIGETTYMSHPEAGDGDESMNVKLYDILAPGLKFSHEYDFGTTTELALKVISEDESEIKGKKIQIQLLARNNPPAIPCGVCGKNATQICAECSYEPTGWLCDECLKKHKCDEDMLLPVVNSPRTGQCGYTGD